MSAASPPLERSAFRDRRREALRMSERRRGDARDDFTSASRVRRAQEQQRRRAGHAGPAPRTPAPAGGAKAAKKFAKDYARFRGASRLKGYSHDWKSGPRPPTMPRVYMHPRRRGSASRARDPEQTRALPRAGPDQRRTDLIMPKRRRYSGRGSYGGAVSSSYIRSKFPKATHGVKYLPRGQTNDPNSAYFEYGPSWAEASDTQRSNRMRDGWRGRGRYMTTAARGRYFYRRRPNVSFYF
ncbi:hypothetical protein [Crucivirus-458]|nr:hypothetical protein [Crucivirus-458]